MKKVFALRPEGKNPDRVLDAVKHEIRKYIKRERRRDLPEGAHFWDFDCRFGADKDGAQAVHPAALIDALDALAKEGASQCYVELLVKPGIRLPGAAEEPAESVAEAGAETGDDAA